MMAWFTGQIIGITGHHHHPHVTIDYSRARSQVAMLSFVKLKEIAWTARLRPLTDAVNSGARLIGNKLLMHCPPEGNILVHNIAHFEIQEREHVV